MDSFNKRKSIFVNADNTSYKNRKALKARMKNQAKELNEIKQRLKRLEDLLLLDNS